MSSQITTTTVGPLIFTPDQINLIKRTIADGASNDELDLFLHQCKRTGLDPLARQIYCTFRWNNVQDKNGKWIKQKRMTIQTSIDGFRLVAERTGKYAGQLGPLWCGQDGIWRDVWLAAEAPAAGKIGIIRSDFKEPLWAVADWRSYVQKTDKGVNRMWQQMGPTMIAKCAESLGLRRAFPQELSGLYTPEEMSQADSEEPEHKAPKAAPDAMAALPPPAEEAPTQVIVPAAPPAPTGDYSPSMAELASDARAAAAMGSAAFVPFFRKLNAGQKVLVQKLGEELRASMDAADLALQEQAETKGKDYDPETGEVYP
jgi:phage recombination protein Bet